MESEDIHGRLDEMRTITDGWLDGAGVAPDSKGLDWLESSVRDHYASNLPLPHIYPVPEGQILFEWFQNGYPIYLAFRPFPRDEGHLSVYDGDIISPGRSYKDYTSDRVVTAQ